MEKKFDILYFLRIAGVLLIICALSAALLATVNYFTADRIKANNEARMKESIVRIFGDSIEIEKVESDSFESPIKDVYKVFSADKTMLGYAVNAVPTGFKGDIEMMVGVTYAGKCKSVEIISMSETPGVGTKVGESDFLDQYHNKSGELVLKDNIQPVAGATISSRAVNLAVNESLKAVEVVRNEA
ncbi:MAG: FMN-binding protein [Clostridia bacterium]|nr:FMN-binding protein [Clostridia bacterium]